MSKKKPIEKFVTPAGRLKYVRVFEADTTFNEDGVFNAQLVLSPEAQPVLKANKDRTNLGNFQEFIDNLVEEALKNAKAEAKPAKRKSISTQLPYEAEYDEDGEETGNLVYKFSTNATFTDKKGETVDKIIKVVNEDLSDFDRDVMIGNGSIGKINFSINQYYIPSMNTAGVKLYLGAVQVLSLVEYTGSGHTGFVAENVDEEGDDLENEPF